MTFPLPVRELGDPGHLSVDHDALRVLYDSQTAPDGYPLVINVRAPHPDISDVAAVGNGTTDDNVALQNIFDWLQGSKAQTHIVWFPYFNANGQIANYASSKPLRVWTGTRIEGPATISAHSTFNWTNHPYFEDALFNPDGVEAPGDIALMELWNDVTGRGAFSRIFIRDITLNGANHTGSIGLLTKLQQPAWTWKLRIDNCRKAGWVCWGQQGDHFFPEIIGNNDDSMDVGLYLGGDIADNFDKGCKFMTFYTLNVEKYGGAAIRSNCDGPNWFYSLHFEQDSSVGSVLFDAVEGGFTIRNGWGTHASPQHVFVIGTQNTTTTGKMYSIEDFRLSATDSSGNQLMIDDQHRGFQRKVGFNRHVGSFRTAFQNDTQHDYDAEWEIIGDEGGFVRIGGVRGASAAPTGHSGAQLSIRPNTSQDERAVRWLSSTGVLRAGVHQSGNLVLGAFANATRPAATTVEAGTMIWNTDDNAPNFSDGSAWRDAAGNVT